MSALLDYPLLLFVLSVIVLLLSTWVGKTLRGRLTLEEDARQYYSIVTAATLGLLSLIIGFTFSMSVTRYDQRKAYEAEEANVIGTEYFRVDLLPGGDKQNVRKLMRNYLNERISFYITRDEYSLGLLSERTARLQQSLWSMVAASAMQNQNSVTSLAVAGMNDVLDRAGFTEAAWRNRLPIESWAMLAMAAICGTMLVGYGARMLVRRISALVILPAVVSFVFFLIADIDSPRGGLIHLHPHNLESLAAALKTSPGAPQSGARGT